MKKVLTILILSLPFYGWSQSEPVTPGVVVCNPTILEEVVDTNTTTIDVSLVVISQGEPAWWVGPEATVKPTLNELSKDEPDIMLNRQTSGFKMNGQFLQYLARR